MRAPFGIGNLNESNLIKNKREITRKVRIYKNERGKNTLRAPTLVKRINIAAEFLIWARKFEGLVAGKGFDSTLSPKTKLPIENLRSKRNSRD